MTETHPVGLRRNWFLSLFTLGAVVLFVAACQPTEQETEPVVDPYTTDFDDQPITSVTALTSLMDPVEMDGREVWLANVRIDELVGDDAFYVVESTTPAQGTMDPDSPTMGQPDTPTTGTTQGERVLVRYDGTFFGDAVENDTENVIMVGNHVDIEGTVRTDDDFDRQTGMDTQTDMGTTGDPATAPGTTDDPMQQPMTDRTTTESIYIDASMVEDHQPGRTAPGTGAGTPPPTGQPPTSGTY